MSDSEKLQKAIDEYQPMADSYKKELNAIKERIDTLLNDDTLNLTYDDPKILALTDAYDCLISQYKGCASYLNALKERLERIKHDPNYIDEA